MNQRHCRNIAENSYEDLELKILQKRRRQLEYETTLQENIAKTLDGWPDWKKKAYNEEFAQSPYTKKLKIGDCPKDSDSLPQDSFDCKVHSCLNNESHNVIQQLNIELAELKERSTICARGSSQMMYSIQRILEIQAYEFFIQYYQINNVNITLDRAHKDIDRYVVLILKGLAKGSLENLTTSVDKLKGISEDLKDSLGGFNDDRKSN